MGKDQLSQINMNNLVIALPCPVSILYYYIRVQEFIEVIFFYVSQANYRLQ